MSRVRLGSPPACHQLRILPWHITSSTLLTHFYLHPISSPTLSSHHYALLMYSDILTTFLTTLYLFLTFTMASSTPTTDASSPVTRIATFRFRPNVTAEQKGGRTSAFLALYAEHPELLLEGPKGGRPLDTPLNLTNVKRESAWDTGFVVVFKVRKSACCVPEVSQIVDLAATVSRTACTIFLHKTSEDTPEGESSRR
jgi:hypothetical protein